jgi:L-malate glycosyltransferase
MRILHTVEFYSPSIGGSQELVKQISEQLISRGHEVTVATSRSPQRKDRNINGVSIEEFDISGNEVNGINGEAERYQQFLINGNFDVVMNYSAQQWATDLLFPVIDRIPYAKVMAPCGFSRLYWSQYAEYYSKLPGILQKYDRLIFHSDNYRDINFVRNVGHPGIIVVPNGALAAEFDVIDDSFRRRYHIPEDSPMLITVGSHTGSKGHRLVIEAFKRAKIGRGALLLIGNTLGSPGCLPDCMRRARWTNFISFGRKKVILLDPPRPDVVAAYHAADLFVFGSNIECSPLVLFEAMASATPFLSVACGNAEEIARWSGGGKIVPTLSRKDGAVDAEVGIMARAIEDLMSNTEELKKLGENGHKAWQERFSWEKIALEYERCYLSAIDSYKNKVITGNEKRAPGIINIKLGR